MKALGPVMVDVSGLALTDEERVFLNHPLVGGVILFARNYRDPAQLRSLTAEIKSLRSPALLIAVDHEGGRVQRFRDGFTSIPPMQAIGDLWAANRNLALETARAAGVVIGFELAAHGVDFSFTPVLDVDYGTSAVIGNRAFSANPEAIGHLAAALVDGLTAAGIAAVGKHFPGHGYVAADSHVVIPRDERSFQDIDATDLQPYRMLIPGKLAGIMPAHVIYIAVDPSPAGFSAIWIQEILRKQLGFEGLIFSDDLTMEGAGTAGGITARANSAFAAGCDMVLVCNAPERARQLARELGKSAPPLKERLAESMRAKPASSGAGALEAQYRDALSVLGALES